MKVKCVAGKEIKRGQPVYVKDGLVFPIRIRAPRGYKRIGRALLDSDSSNGVVIVMPNNIVGVDLSKTVK